MSVSERGASISMEFVDPFMTTRQAELIQQFLRQPYGFQWNGETTLVDIQTDLSKHLAVELDVRALEEIGLSGDVKPVPVTPRKKLATSNTKSMDPFGRPGRIDDEEAKSDEKEEDTDSETTESNVSPSVSRWWADDTRDDRGKSVRTNGGVLFHYLDSVDLTLNIQNGLLKITTMEAAEQACCTWVYDVTSLVDQGQRHDTLPGVGAGIPDARNKYQGLIDLLQTSVVPDTWEALGGPSTIALYSHDQRGRLVVNTPLVIHWKIAGLLNRLNR